MNTAAMSNQAATIGLENSDRIARFRRLADLQGMAPPLVDQLYAPPGSVPGVAQAAPVVRVMFQESAFFASGSDVPRPEAAPILDLIAENMRRDVPDAALTLLGHTDATGSDALNIDLSRRRAASVMAGLIARGVSPSQLDTVAIGRSQPIASNMTASGRARNRRVEFMISGSDAANLAVISNRLVNRAFFKLASARPPVTPPLQVALLKPDRAPTGSMDFSFLKQTSTIALAPPRDVEPASESAPSRAPRDIEPASG